MLDSQKGKVFIMRQNYYQLVKTIKDKFGLKIVKKLEWVEQLEHC